jgi:ATP-binding protein involved in chromosome partitioning
MKNYKDIVGDGGSNVVAQVGEQLDRLNQRLASVRHIIAVMSGKGGVGKSSVTVNVASALALEGASVGILDADINGSSIPTIAGVRGRELHRGRTGVVPPVNALNMKVMSIDLLLDDDRAPVEWDATSNRDAYTWRAMMEMGAVREFFADTEWGRLDYLFVDLPPGTDKLPNIVDLLPRISGTIIVSIPALLSQFVVGKSIHMAKETLNTPIIGVVENMATHVCPHCGKEEALFPDGSVERMAAEAGIPYLGRIPFDSRIAAAADEEALFMQTNGESAAGRDIRSIAAGVKAFVEGGAP